MTKNLGLELHSKHACKMILMKDLFCQLELSVQLLALGETSAYPMERALCANLELITTKMKSETSISFEVFFV